MNSISSLVTSGVLLYCGWKAHETFEEFFFDTTEYKTHTASLNAFQNETTTESSNPILEIADTITKPIRFLGRSVTCLTQDGLKKKASCIMGQGSTHETDSKVFAVSFFALLAII